MYLFAARATWSTLCPGLAATNSPSMRTFSFWVKPGPPSVVLAADVAPQAPCRLFHRRRRGQAERHLDARPHPLPGRDLARDLAGALALLLRRLHRVLERRPQGVHALHAHEPLVDLAGGLPSVAHRPRDVRGPGDEVAPRVEALAARLHRVAVHLDGARLLDLEPRARGEAGVDLLADGEDHGVAVRADDLVGGDRPAAARGVELAELRLHHLDRLHRPLLVAHDPVG